MRRPGTIFLFAIVIGALCSALVYRSLNTQRAEIEAARRAMQLGTIDVIVANQPIAVGAHIDAAQVKTVRWPADIPPEGAIKDTTTVTGRIARTAIDKNQPIVESQLVGEGTGLLSLLITEGMRGMSVKVDDVTGVSGFITPNSRVDVLVSGSDGSEGGGGQRSKVILQNVKVLAIGKSIEQKDNKPVEVPTVTLLVTPQDAEKLTLATGQGPVRLALRNYRDEEFVGTQGVSQKALFGSAPPPPAPSSPSAPMTKVARRSAPAPYVVDVLLGTKVMRQQFDHSESREPAHAVHEDAETLSHSTLPVTPGAAG